MFTDHDRRHSIVVEYMKSNNTADERKVAEALRPILEQYVRVAYPEDFPPGSLLGRFANKCEQNLGKSDEILNEDQLSELQALIKYSNRYHHDNPTWETEIINDQELQHFCARVLKFTRR